MDEILLSDLFVANDDFDELEQALDVFCPFEAVGMVNQEIRHGHFLSSIFDPNRPHGFGSDCLRALMAAATRAEGQFVSSLTPLDVHMMDFDGATVRREWRNIDILIDVSDQKLIVAIELKINANEHSGQLRRYREIVQKEWPDCNHLFLFLTKHGDEPSEEDGEAWLSVELDKLANELTVVAKRGSGDSGAKAMLNAYIAMLGRHHLSDPKLETLAASLWAKHSEALNFLAERRPDNFGRLFEILTDRASEIADSISKKSKIEVEADFHRPAALRFAVPEWDKIDGFCSADGFTLSNRLILIEIVKASGASSALRCYFLLGKGDKNMREKLHQTLEGAGATNGRRLTKDWNRLASKSFKLGDIEDESDVEKIAERVAPQIIEFIASKLPSFRDALGPLAE
ncbi:MAG: PD-(D/E)XK nuclease family protein [Sphingorhabdus sp.]